jgi:hypothetical protein
VDPKDFINWLLQAAICAVGLLLISKIDTLSGVVEVLRDQVSSLRIERAADRVLIEQHDMRIRRLEDRR